jgi:RimJ/RimL family protein N-acetyltransferase
VIFDKAYWGRGIGKNALKQFCRLVFERYAIDKLCAFTYADNKRSIGSLEGAGYKKIEAKEIDKIITFL